MADEKREGSGLSGSMTRRDFVKTAALTGAAVAAAPLVGRGRAFAQAKTGTVRVWGEPGPYAAVAVDAMNEWASKNSPGIKFTLEIISWEDVYMKLMTDLAAKQPPNCVSVESPIAFQLMAEGLLEPVDDVIDKVGRDRMIDSAKWWYWGAWKDKQYVVPAHHQSNLFLVRTDVVKEMGFKDPDTWDWNDLFANAKAIKEKKKGKMNGFVLALGRNLCTEEQFSGILHSAGARMFDQENKFQVIFDSPQTAEALEFVGELYAAAMPKGATGYSYLDCVDSMVTGESAMTYYWGRVYGRAAEENKAVYAAIETYIQPRHPKTGFRYNWNDFQGWLIPKDNNPYINEVKQALIYMQTNKDWMARYYLSLVPNISPMYKDVLANPDLYKHPMFETKKKSIMVHYVEALKYASNSGNELLKGINPLAGVVHGRALIAQTVQKVVIDNWAPKKAAQWGAKELESVRREHMRSIM